MQCIKWKSVEFGSNVLEQGAVILLAWHGVDGSPAVLTVVLQAGHTAAEEGGWFSIALHPVTFITHLSIQNVGLDLNLKKKPTNKHVSSIFACNYCSTPIGENRTTCTEQCVLGSDNHIILQVQQWKVIVYIPSCPGCHSSVAWTGLRLLQYSWHERWTPHRLHLQ